MCVEVYLLYMYANYFAPDEEAVDYVLDEIEIMKEFLEQIPQLCERVSSDRAIARGSFPLMLRSSFLL
jgi:hypothetical protein